MEAGNVALVWQQELGQYFLWLVKSDGTEVGLYRTTDESKFFQNCYAMSQAYNLEVKEKPCSIT